MMSAALDRSLDQATLGDVERRLAAHDEHLASAYPGDDGTRQPVHTVYVPAHRYAAGLAEEWGDRARKTLAAQGTDALLDAAGVRADLRDAVASRVEAKLAAEPIEDLRIDLEDGYGDHPDADEDAVTLAAARALRTELDEARATPFVGIRFKCFDLTIEAYHALETLLADDRVRAIGVSNFMPDHLDRLLEATKVVPAVNQVEVHPYFRQPDVLEADAKHGILTQAWSPIGGITFYRDGEHTSTLDDPTLLGIGEDHGKSAAQVMLRWHLQQGRSAIPKSVTPQRIAENFDVLDFELTAGELAAIDALDTGVRGGPDPADITLESFSIDIPEA